MQPIQLTEEHKSKLLEMCKALFPEFKKGGNFYILNHLHKPGEYESSINELSEANTNFVTFHNFGKKLLKKETVEEHFKKWFNSIHWFEFCFLQLCLELWKKVDLTIYDQYEEGYWKMQYDLILSSHPIDFLYSEFKKLKL